MSEEPLAPETTTITDHKSERKKPSFSSSNMIITFAFLITWTVLGGIAYQGYTMFTLLKHSVATISAEQLSSNMAPPVSAIDEEYTTKLNSLELRLQALANKEPEKIVVKETITTTPVEPQIEADTVTSASTALNSYDSAMLPLVNERVTQLEQHLQQQTLLLAMIDLQEALMSHDPFRNSLDRVMQLLQDNPELQTYIEPFSSYADEGLPRIDQLHDSFKTMAKQLVKSYQNPNQSLKDKVVSKLSRYVRIHKIDNANNSVLAILHRAETTLEQGNVKEAVSFLTQLPKEAKPFSSDWVRSAHSYIAAKELVNYAYEKIVSSFKPVNTHEQAPTPGNT